MGNEQATSFDDGWDEVEEITREFDVAKLTEVAIQAHMNADEFERRQARWYAMALDTTEFFSKGLVRRRDTV